MQQEDDKLKVQYNKKVHSRDIGTLWALAYYALLDNGMEGKLAAMQERIKKSPTQPETLKIIQDYVKFV